MVDVAAKAVTAREALAEGFLRLAPAALALVREELQRMDWPER